MRKEDMKSVGFNLMSLESKHKVKMELKKSKEESLKMTVLVNQKQREMKQEKYEKELLTVRTLSCSAKGLFNGANKYVLKCFGLNSEVSLEKVISISVERVLAAWKLQKDYAESQLDMEIDINYKLGLMEKVFVNWKKILVSIKAEDGDESHKEEEIVHIKDYLFNCICIN